MCSFPSWSQHKVKTLHWLIPLREPPVPDNVCYSDAQKYFSQSSRTRKLRQKSGASTDPGMQTHRKAWGRGGSCKYHSQRRTGVEGPLQQSQCWRSETAGAQRDEAPSSYLHMETSSFFILVVLSKEFCPTKSSSVWTQPRKAPNGHQEWGLATPSRELAGASLQLLLQTSNEGGDIFCSLSGRGSGTTAVLLPCTLHWAATEWHNAPSLGKGSTNASVILLLLFPNELN